MDTLSLAKSFKDKVVLVTGGTGSFGEAFVKKLLTEFEPKKVIVFSRDEKKQFDMGNQYHDKRLQLVTGDVRERDVVYHFMTGVDYVFHAAALKQVPNCEFFPLEAIRTNILGSYHVLDAAVERGVERVVVLSTDKAAYPVSAMGMTKALMERVMIAIAREKRGKTVLCGTRYGNVMFTRGSVLPYFINQMQKGEAVTITRKDMTRFMMSLQDSIDLVCYAMINGNPGDLFVNKSPASTVLNIAESLVNIFNYKQGITEIGLRPGEKMHETLITKEEFIRAEEMDDFYRIHPESFGMDYKDYYFRGAESKSKYQDEGFASNNTKLLSLEETQRLISALPEIQEIIKLGGIKS